MLGIIDVQSDVVGALNDDDRLLLESISGPIALAIESTTLRQEMEDNLRRLTAVQRAMSEQGWAAYRNQEALPEGYLYDRLAVRSASNLWAPEIARAVREGSLVASDLEGSAEPVAVSPMLVQGQSVGVLGVYDDPQHPLLEGIS